MDDIDSVKFRHGHYEGKGLWWIDHGLVDNKKCVLMVMFGSSIIGDKTCFRIGDGIETWFEPESTDRDQIIKQGKEFLKKKLKGKDVKNLDGTPYTWE